MPLWNVGVEPMTSIGNVAQWRPGALSLSLSLTDVSCFEGCWHLHSCALYYIYVATRLHMETTLTHARSCPFVYHSWQWFHMISLHYLNVDKELGHMSKDLKWLCIFFALTTHLWIKISQSTIMLHIVDHFSLIVDS